MPRECRAGFRYAVSLREKIQPEGDWRRLITGLHSSPGFGRIGSNALAPGFVFALGHSVDSVLTGGIWQSAARTGQSDSPWRQLE